MGLVTTKDILNKALKGGYAVGGFNVNNMESIQSIIEAAKQEKSPVILQVSAGARKYANQVYLRKLVEAAIEESGLDLSLHLDHGDTFELCKSCIDNGFTSVMIDGSHLPYEENIKLTKQVVEYAHSKNVVVEAELGRIAGVEDDINVDAKDSSYTDPEQAVDFINRTGADSLAIAVGTSHGAFKFKGEPTLDYDRIKKISDLLPNTPLVLHGASSIPQEWVKICNEYGGNIPGAKGVPEHMIKEATKYNICKVNIDSDLRIVTTATIRKLMKEKPDVFDPRAYLGAAREEVTKMIANKMKNALGSNNKI